MAGICHYCKQMFNVPGYVCDNPECGCYICVDCFRNHKHEVATTA